MSLSRFQDRVALVTGAAQGIGRRVAERLLEEGAYLLLVDRSEHVHSLAQDRVKTITADLETFAGAQAAADAAIAAYGRIDILINNAGVQDDETAIDVNLKGLIAVTEKYGLQKNIKSILMNASVSAHILMFFLN